MLRLKIRLFCTFPLALQSVIAHQFVPRGDIEQRYGNKLQRRLTCEPATPDVNESAVFTDVCNENPQNNFNDCFNKLVQYAQDSALNICNRYYTLYNSCLVANNYSESACADSRAGYVYCSNYTIQAYAYCGCYFVTPDQLYNCANVELEIDSHRTPGPVPSNTILSSALLNGPVAPSTATLSNIPSSAPTSNLPVFTPRQTSTLFTSTVLVTSTFVATSCASNVSNCPATTYSSTFASPSSYWACGSAGCVIPPLPLPPASVSTSASGLGSTSAGGTQSTSTLVTTVPVTRTSTITTCPKTVTPCPLHYSSESTYTTTTVSTILSCNGGCDTGPSRAGECVVRQRTKALRAREL